MKEIESLFDIYKDAVYEKDEARFLSIFDETLHVFDMWAWEYEGLPAWQGMVKGWFGSLGSERVAVTFEDVRVRAGEEMAYASAVARFAAVGEDGVEIRSLQNRLSWVVVKKAGVWKIIHEHTSGPADHSTLKIQLQKKG